MIKCYSPLGHNWVKAKDQSNTGELGIRYLCTRCSERQTRIKPDYKPKEDKQ